MSSVTNPKEHPLKACRTASVPLVGFETADPAQTIRDCLKALNGKVGSIPEIAWDICRGLIGLNQLGEKAIAWYDPLAHQLPDILKILAEKGPKGAIFFVHNAQRFLERDGVAQGLWLLRDAWKGCGATCILLGPSIQLPGELVQDVVVINEPLPDAAGISAIVDQVVIDSNSTESGQVIAPDYPKAKVVDTLLGLSAFAAEQALAMSISKKGINQDSLWERKRRLVEQTPGLSVWKGNEAFDSLGGLSNIKSFLKSVLTSGKTPVRAIGFIDEIEKGFAGAGGDLSGVSQDQLQVFLKVMQDFEIPGIILVGPPGTGKSAIAKAAGSISGAEVLSIDTGAMTGSLVGESQAKIRAAMETFKAVSQGKGLFIATCNRLASLPPELRRRFTLGTFYVDLPTAEERITIWDIWLKRYAMTYQDAMPDDEGWTGAEIKACCEVAYRCGMSLVQASEFVVPVCKSASDKIEELRKGASGKFISANYPGVYQMDKQSAKAGTKRALTFN